MLSIRRRREDVSKQFSGRTSVERNFIVDFHVGFSLTADIAMFTICFSSFWFYYFSSYKRWFAYENLEGSDKTLFLWF